MNKNTVAIGLLLVLLVLIPIIPLVFHKSKLFINYSEEDSKIIDRFASHSKCMYNDSIIDCYQVSYVLSYQKNNESLVCFPISAHIPVTNNITIVNNYLEKNYPIGLEKQITVSKYESYNCCDGAIWGNCTDSTPWLLATIGVDFLIVCLIFPLSYFEYSQYMKYQRRIRDNDVYGLFDQ